MAKKSLKNELQSPSGIFYLFVFTFLTAAVLAILVASNRNFFEKFVREKYPPTTEVAAKVLRDAKNRAALPDSLPASLHQSFYDAWMSAPDTLPHDLPQKMFAAAPKIYEERVKRTLIVGDTAQRNKARLFLQRAQISIENLNIKTQHVE